MDLDKNIAIGLIISNVVQQRMNSINRIHVSLGRPSTTTSNKSHVHCTTTIDYAILKYSN